MVIRAKFYALVYSSLVIDHLSSAIATEKVCVAFIYCDYREQKQQSAENMTEGILKQAITAANTVPEELVKRKAERKGALELKDAVQALSRTLRSFDRTYLCIEALDERLEEHRYEFIRCLNELGASDSNHPPFIRIFLTGRPLIKNEVNSHPSVVANPRTLVSMLLEANTGDIAAYVTHKISMHTRVRMDEDFKRQIVAEITAASQGMLVVAKIT